MDDQEITARVQRALNRSTESAGIDVKVETQNGIVQLSGVVDVLSQRQQAEEVARQVQGVRGVANGVTVAMDGEIADEHIREELGSKLNSGETRGIGAEVRRGRVTLVGRVDNLSQAEEAYRAASGTRGVREVRSELHLAADTPGDVAVVNRTKDVLTAAGFAARHIAAAAEDGRVTLTGWVDTNEERQAAEAVISGVDGVRAVDNELGVRQGHEEV